MGHARSSLGLALRPIFLLAGFAVIAGAGHADGMFLASRALGRDGRPSSSAQKAVMIREGAEEVLLLQTTYQGPTAAFVWVVPVPAVPADVFEAEPLFLDEVFRNTEPFVVTTLSGRTSAPAPPATKGASAGAPAQERSAHDVTVHQRLEVGDYDASVLSATGAGALTVWLQGNGYEVPLEAGAALQPYVKQGFAFVAVRFLTGVADGKPTVTSVAPLGIRFATEKLLFPLGISRGSAPPLTSILLCVLDDGPVDCETIPATWVGPKSRRLAKGETYGTVRRELTRLDGAAHLLCEYSGTEAVTYDDLSYRADQWASLSLTTGLPDRHATRFFALLPVEEMQDLWFVPAPDRPADYRVMVERKGNVGPQALRQWQAWSKADAARRYGLPVEWVSAAGSRVGWREPGAAPPAWARVVGVCLLVGVAVGLVRLWRRRVPPGALLALLLVGLAVRVGLAGGDAAAARELDTQLRALDEALRSFVTDTGGYPAALEDLAATSAPAELLDLSGNIVPKKGEWKGPYVHELPPDLLGGELSYDVLNLRPIDAGGWSITVRGATRDDVERTWATGQRRARKAGARAPYRPSFWVSPQATDLAEHTGYARWLAGGSAHGLLVGRAPGGTQSSYGPGAGGVQSYTTVVADPARGQCFTLGAGTVAVNGHTGLALSAEQCGRLYADPDRATALYGLFATSRDSLLTKASVRPIRARVTRGDLSRDGLRLAVWDSRTPDASAVLVRTSSGPFREVTRGRFLEGEFAPDGSAIYLLGWLEPDFDRALESWSRQAALRRPANPDRRHDPADLIRLPLDGSAPEVISSGLDPRFLTVSKQGVLAYRADGNVLLFPLGGGAPAEMPIPEGTIMYGARAFDDGIVTIVAGTSQQSPPPGVSGGSFFRAEAYVRARPQGPSRRATTLKLVPRSEAGIVGLTHEGTVVLAWHAETEPAAPWVVKAIAADGSARMLEHQEVPEALPASHGARTNRPDTEPTAGASLP